FGPGAFLSLSPTAGLLSGVNSSGLMRKPALAPGATLDDAAILRSFLRSSDIADAGAFPRPQATAAIAEPASVNVRSGRTVSSRERETSAPNTSGYRPCTFACRRPSIKRVDVRLVTSGVLRRGRLRPVRRTIHAVLIPLGMRPYLLILPLVLLGVACRRS